MIKTITKNQKELPYKINKTNNKNTYFKVKVEYIQVNKAKSMSESNVIKYLNDNFDKFYESYMSEKNRIPEEDEIILEGIKYKLILIKDNDFSYLRVGNELICYTKEADYVKVKKNIYKYHLEQMLQRIEDEVSNILKLNNIKEREIEIKYFKTRYGSYHKKQDLIKLNKVLAKADIMYTYYVLMHEYAHTINFDHSKNYYNTLKKLMPNYKKYDKEIKKLSIYI